MNILNENNIDTAAIIRGICNTAIGLGFIAYCIARLIFARKRYFFKPVEYVQSRLIAVALAGGVFYMALAALVFLQYTLFATILHIIIALFSWFVFISLFNYKKAGNNVSVSKEIEDEINTRYGIEDKLINKNKQLEWAERTAKICYCAWDLRKNEIRFSDGAEDIFDIDPQKSIRFENLMSIIIPEDRIKIQRFIEAINENKESGQLLFRIIIGSKLKYIQMKSEVYESITSHSFIRGTFQDVTEQQMFVKRIEDKNEILKDIAWTQSHDVRGPLATVMGLVDLLDEEDFKTGQNKEIVQGLKESSVKLDEIIKKIVKKTASVDVDLS